jgi:vacuolar-type H+-ATPase subunit I/STV1
MKAITSIKRSIRRTYVDFIFALKQRIRQWLVIDHLQQDIDSHLERIGSLEDELNELRKEFERLESNVDDAGDLESRITELEEGYEDRFSELESQLEEKVDTDCVEEFIPDDLTDRIDWDSVRDNFDWEEFLDVEEITSAVSGRIAERLTRSVC